MKVKVAIEIVALFVGIVLCPGMLIAAGWDPDTRTYSHEGYISLKKVSETGNTASFEAGTNWEDGNPPNKDNKYYVPSGASLRMLNTCTTPFKGAVLATEGDSTWQGQIASVPVYHLLSGAGFTFYNFLETFTNGVWTLYPTDGSKWVRAKVNVNSASASQIERGIKFIDVAMKGDADTRFEVANNSALDWVGMFFGSGADFSEFFGTISFTFAHPESQYAVFAPPKGYDFTMPGTLDLPENSILKADNDTSYEVTLGNLLMGAGAEICLSWVDAAMRTITVTGRFEHADAKARIDAGAASTDLKGSGSVTALTTIPPAQAVPFRLKAPSESIDPCISVDDFEVGGTTGAFGLPTSTLSVQREDGYDKLVLATKGIVRKKHTSDTPSSFVDGTYWTDGLAPHPGWDYFSVAQIRPMAENAYADWDFKGDSLTFGSKSNTKGSLAFDSTARDIRVEKLTFGSGCSVFSYSSKARLVSQQIKVVADDPAAFGAVVMQAYNGTKLWIDGPISGDADIWYQYRGNNLTDGYIYPLWINDGHTGRVKLACQFYNVQPHEQYTPAEDKRIQVTVWDGKNLGGEMAEFTYDGIRLRDWSLLNITNTTEFTAVNRGVFIDWVGCIDVASNKTATFWAPFTFGGVLKKQGDGMLALGGTAPKFAVGTTDNYVIQDNPVVGTNVLEVTKGSIKPLSKDAFNGLEVKFAKGTELHLDYNSTNEDIRTYGLYDAKGLVLFDDNVEKIDVVFDVSPEELQKGVGGKFGIMTVPTSQAEQVQAKLNVIKPMRGVKITYLERIAVDEHSTRIVANVEARHGLVIMLRSVNED